MEFFSTLEQILTTQDPHRKIASFDAFYQAYQAKQIFFDHSYKPITFQTPSYHDICQITPATTLPKRGSLSSDRGKAYLIHSILHIEYSAIDLALDHAYRFSGMPQEYYDDWLEVAEDETRHFLMLEKMLHTLGYRYGSFPVHSFLFDVCQKTQDLLSRMAVIPRYLEASGLDSNPLVIEKLRRIDDLKSRKIIELLEVILEEEVSHVQKGDRWFLWACQKEGVAKECFFDIVEHYLPGAKRKKHFVNIPHRKRAGFSCEEIAIISNQKCE